MLVLLDTKYPQELKSLCKIFCIFAWDFINPHANSSDKNKLNVLIYQPIYQHTRTNLLHKSESSKVGLR